MNNLKDAEHFTKNSTKGNEAINTDENYNNYSPLKIITEGSKAYEKNSSFSKKIKVTIEEQY